MIMLLYFILLFVFPMGYFGITMKALIKCWTIADHIHSLSHCVLQALEMFGEYSLALLPTLHVLCNKWIWFVRVQQSALKCFQFYCKYMMICKWSCTILSSLIVLVLLIVLIGEQNSLKGALGGAKNTKWFMHGLQISL